MSNPDFALAACIALINGDGTADAVQDAIDLARVALGLDQPTASSNRSPGALVDDVRAFYTDPANYEEEVPDDGGDEGRKSGFGGSYRPR